jgi:hypothetical protein
MFIGGSNLNIVSEALMITITAILLLFVYFFFSAIFPTHHKNISGVYVNTTKSSHRLLRLSENKSGKLSGQLFSVGFNQKRAIKKLNLLNIKGHDISNKITLTLFHSKNDSVKIFSGNVKDGKITLTGAKGNGKKFHLAFTGNNTINYVNSVYSYILRYFSQKRTVIISNQKLNTLLQEKY